MSYDDWKLAPPPEGWTEQDEAALLADAELDTEVQRIQSAREAAMDEVEERYDAMLDARIEELREAARCANGGGE
jgi:hypothetical protein